MIKVQFGNGKALFVEMTDKDFRRLLVAGANAICGQIEEQIDQDDFMRPIQRVRLENDYDVLQDMIHSAEFESRRDVVIVDGAEFRNLRLCINCEDDQ